MTDISKISNGTVSYNIKDAEARSGLNGKLDGFTLRFAGNWTGGVHAVNFVTIDYSECNSENGVFIKFSMVNSHGNGQAGKFLQDVVLNVKYTGEVAGTLYRYFAVPIDQASSEYYGSHYYGDVFWVNDTTNKIVKFYVLMHQYSYTSQSPYFRLNASTKGAITQSTGGAYKEEYSSGTRVWTTVNWFETDQTYSATSSKPQSGLAVASAISGKANSADLATVATSGSYNDLSNKPTIPTVNNATLTIQNNGSTVATFTANASSNVTANISVPNVTDIYSATSTDGMSGIAVKSAIDSAVSSVYKPAGSIAFASLPTPSSSNLGNVYNMTDSFTTDSRFVEGSGNNYPAGTNVVIINTTGTTYYAWEEPFSEDIWTTSESPNIGDAIYYIRDETVTKSSQTVTEITNGYIKITNASRPYYRESRYDTTIPLTGYFFDVLAGMVDLSNYVPVSRTINGKALSNNISLTASDVGALSSSTVIPTVNNATLTITQGGTTKGTFTANASSNVTIDLDAGGATYTAGDGIDITNNEISVDGVQTSELSIDTTPTQSSSNLITSGGVYDVLGDVETLINAL